MELGDLLSSLGEDDVKKLKEMASQFFGGGEGEKPESPKQPAAGFTGDFDPGLIKSVARLSSVMNARDPRGDFMLSLKPLLSEKRRKKADDAVMLLRVFRLLSETEGLR